MPYSITNIQQLFYKLDDDLYKLKVLSALSKPQRDNILKKMSAYKQRHKNTYIDKIEKILY